MTAKTIITITTMLKDETKKAKEAYDMFRETMINKYKTDWIHNEMNEDESKLLRNLTVKYGELGDALADFENHQW